MTASQRRPINAPSTGIRRDVLESLPVRPRRREQESEEGHWLRVAHLNGLSDPKWLLASDQGRVLSIIRFCPQCLSQTGAVWNVDWREREKPYCVIHRLWLVDRCAACGRLTKLNAVTFAGCKCGADLRSIHGRTFSDLMVRIVASGLAPTDVLLWLGALSRYGLTMKPLKKASRVGMQEIADLCEEGAIVVAEWPEAFYGGLDRSRLDSDALGALRSLNSALPGLPRLISRLRHEPWKERVLGALGDYVAMSHQSAAPITGRNVPGDRRATVAQRAHELGLRTTRLIAALDRLPNGLVAVRQTKQGRCRRLISDEVAHRVRQTIADEIPTKGAARHLGLSPARINQLVEAGLLKRQRGCLSRSEIEMLSTGLLGAAKGEQLPTDAIVLARAFRYCVPISRTSGFVKAILDGTLMVHAPDGTTAMTDLLMSESQCRAWKTTTGVVPAEMLTIPVLAEVLGVKQEVAYHLIRVGLIPTQEIKIGPHRSARMVTARAVSDFRARHEALVRLAAQAGIGSRTACGWARAQGIEFVSGPSIDGGRQYVVRIPTL